MAARLLFQGPSGAQEILLQDQTVVIGRGLTCHVRFDSAYLSEVHCQVACLDGRWTLQDRHSSNGTFVNGERQERYPLRSGDVITCGPGDRDVVRLTFLDDEGDVRELRQEIEHLKRLLAAQEQRIAALEAALR